MIVKSLFDEMNERSEIGRGHSAGSDPLQRGTSRTYSCLWLWASLLALR
jgi:hypothetical protein